MTTTPPAPPPAASGTRLFRLAVLGMLEGNDQPYSWSAITHGHDPAAHGQMQVRLTDTYTAFRHQLRSFIDFARTGRREVAGAVAFLLSDASSYITGANLPVDGGYELHATIPGFMLEEADRIHTSNEINRRVTWRGRADAAPLAGRPVRLRFVMRDADLYAFQFRSEDSPR